MLDTTLSRSTKTRSPFVRANASKSSRGMTSTAMAGGRCVRFAFLFALARKCGSPSLPSSLPFLPFPSLPGPHGYLEACSVLELASPSSYVASHVSTSGQCRGAADGAWTDGIPFPLTLPCVFFSFPGSFCTFFQTFSAADLLYALIISAATMANTCSLPLSPGP